MEPRGCHRNGDRVNAWIVGRKGSNRVLYSFFAAVLTATMTTCRPRRSAPRSTQCTLVDDIEHSCITSEIPVAKHPCWQHARCARHCLDVVDLLRLRPSGVLGPKKA